jgi:hypothetical protein
MMWDVVLVNADFFMKQKLLAAIALLSLCLVLLVNIEPGRTEEPIGEVVLPQSAPRLQITPNRRTAPTIGCATQPDPVTGETLRAEVPTLQVRGPLTLDRFRQLSGTQVAVANSAEDPAENSAQASARPRRLTLEFLRSTRTGSSENSPERSPRNSSRRASSYIPEEEIALADSTNYGDRFFKDLQGKSAVYPPIVVLHETVGSASSAINLFQTPHPRDEDQVSYHSLIKADGTIVYLVPPDKRAFGAGNSAFEGNSGTEAVQTNPDFPASVNNFAYHISLETPSDGDHNGDRHSGYTEAQYQSLAWLVAKTGVPDERLTTHQQVDRSGLRKDPRSFETRTLLQLLNEYSREPQITIGCSES